MKRLNGVNFGDPLPGGEGRAQLRPGVGQGKLKMLKKLKRFKRLNGFNFRDPLPGGEGRAQLRPGVGQGKLKRLKKLKRFKRLKNLLH